MGELSDRIKLSYKALGHPQSSETPEVEEGVHYTVLAYTDWADLFIPTVIKWAHGETDDFTEPGKTLANFHKAIQFVEGGEK
jgi:hypothetical protein